MDNALFGYFAATGGQFTMTQMTLYLASASPRRREILDNLGITHGVLPQDIDESRLAGEPPREYVVRLAMAKAEAALASLDGDPGVACLGSDTTVVCLGEMFEKPEDEADARRMLSALSGNTHQVLTAVALATMKGTQVIISESDVTFRTLTDAEIQHYWQTGEPADKAGAYGIQGLGGIFVTEIRGSYSGIMGLPVQETVNLLSGVGLGADHILEQHHVG